MSTIVLRSVKGTPLTNTEVDANFSNLNTDKIQIGGTYSSGTANGVLYLNGSKVAATGSGLTFDGTTLSVSALNATTIDLTNLEITNLKAKDGTAGMQIADSTGVVSFTSNPVISGSTANGVFYSSGSKVLTSGSALTFDGTYFTGAGSISGWGTNAISTKQASTNAYQGIVSFASTNTNAVYIGHTGSVGTLGTGYATTGGETPIVFEVNVAEKMRLTSTGLGIGTSSPTNKLTVDGNANITGNTTLGDASADTVTINGTVQPGVVISGSSTGDALRITQTGNGNALVVEDAANPDSTPFVIDASGGVIVGNTSTTALNYTSSPRFQVAGTSQATTALSSVYAGSSAHLSGSLLFGKSTGTLASPTAVVSGDDLGRIQFEGHDGTAFIPSAQILAEVDGTPGTNDMPGRLVFSTTADGASSPTERIRITSAGKTGFATSAPAATVHVAGDTILSNVNVIGASYDSVSFSVAGEELTPQDVFFSPDGLKMYVIGSSGDDVNEYNLSTAWVVSSAVYSTTFFVSQDGTPQGLYFRADGLKMYVVGATNDSVFQYTLSTPWSVATASYDNISFSVAGQEITPTSISFKSNGLSMYVAGATGDAVYQYTLSTAWDVSTATFLQSFSISGQETGPNGMSFTSDGSRMFVVGTTGDDVNVYNLTTPWDISTSAFVGVFSVSGQDTSPNGIYIKPDGTKMYIVGATNDTVFQYTVPSIDIQLTGPTSVAALAVQQDLTVYGNTTGSFLNNSFRENLGGQYYNLVSQADIGTAPNEIPLNQYLGEMAYMNAKSVVIQPQASAVPNGIGDMVFQLTSDTSLEIKVKGSDGTVRSVTLTLA